MNTTNIRNEQVLLYTYWVSHKDGSISGVRLISFDKGIIIDVIKGQSGQPCSNHRYKQVDMKLQTISPMQVTTPVPAIKIR